MIYLELFLSFILVGFTSFGGISMIPLISNQMISHGWMTVQEVSDIVAIAEMTPGSLGLNCSTFAGMRTAGPLGAFVAALGVLMPTYTIGMFVAIALKKYRESNIMNRMLYGIRPASIGLIVSVIIQLGQSNYFLNKSISLPAVGIGIGSSVVLFKYKWSIPKTILLSGGLGLVCGTIFGFV